MSIKRCSSLISLCGCVFLFALAFGAVGYAMGWIDFANEPERATIRIDKQELKSDAKEAAKATEEFFEKTGETVQEATESLSTGESDEPVSEESDHGEQPAAEGTTSPTEQ